jgi:hypothetical protein
MADCICVRRGDGPEGCGICNETGTTPEIAGLCERLRVVEYSREPSDWSGIRQVTTNRLRNPDGPQAADTLERQAAEIERLRGALTELADAITAAWPGLENLAPLARAQAALTGEDA